MRNIIRNMDKASRDLDERYMSIRNKETQLEIHKRALSMLREAGLDDQIIQEQVQLHEDHEYYAILFLRSQRDTERLIHELSGGPGDGV